MFRAGRLFIVSAPSGAGKTSLVQKLVKQASDVVASISHTTRKQRHGEIDGKDYFFISHDKFNQMVKTGKFIEHAKVFDNYYGTSLQSVRDLLQQGMKVILEIDWQGARQVRTKMKNTTSIFILPPSEKELASRLRTRGQDSEEVITRRMSDAKSEISHYEEFDYIIINDDFDRAYQELSAFISNPERYLPFCLDNIRPLALDILNRS